ncbi:MAG TPA: glycosyltransferase family 4 protein [Bacteroidales bacterium]|nr:glycosyltransferase family 4 protein [Bacteroidales bacterium]HQJ21595.1 glycosyltransferase family 4 protein [Bacteroidales bacterium]
MDAVFIFKSNTRGMQYGIGSYINELTEALLTISNLDIYIVSYYYWQSKEFEIKKISPNLDEIIIPAPLNSIDSNKHEKYYALAVARLLSVVIDRYQSVIFQINYINDLQIAKELKRLYDFPIVSVVHFAQWQQIFNGDIKKLSGLNINNPTNNVEFTLSVEREMYRISDRIISVTSYMKDFLVDYYGIDHNKITVIPNGLNKCKYYRIDETEKAALRKRLGFEANEIIILFSGRIDACKGIFHLIEAFEVASSQNSNLRLVLIGQGEIAECQKRMKTSFGKVNFPGFLSKELLMSFYHIADMGIAPSVYDHCPYTILEMMASRIPIIASRISGLNEILDDNQCLFINPVIDDNGNITFNSKELSDAILTLAGDSSLRNKLANNSYKNLCEKYSAIRMAEEMNKLYMSTIKSCNKVSKK